MGKDYFLGLDIGSTSVGWAVVDNDYKVVRKSGKALWGVRLFDEAQTAEDRRKFRTARRRGDRRKVRLGLLREFFEEAIGKVDPWFFMRLKESKFHHRKLKNDGTSDKSDPIQDVPWIIFDTWEAEKAFHTTYPTIYHLRKDLMSSTEAKDPRYVYLAIHHILKHRGNFLREGTFKEAQAFGPVWQTLCEAIEAEFEVQIASKEDETKISDCLKRDEKKEARSKSLLSLLTFEASEGAEDALASDKKFQDAFAGLLCGRKVDLVSIFGKEILSEEEEGEKKGYKITFEDDFDAKADEHLRALGDDNNDILLKFKAVYDWSVLAKTLGKHNFLSEAKVEVYENHQTDLKRLKKVLKAYGPKVARAMLAQDAKDKEANYCTYVGRCHVNRQDVILKKHSTQEKFYESLKKVLKKIETEKAGVCFAKEASEILTEIDLGKFLPKQVNKDNGVIPHQIHLMELERILENAGTYLPFLSEKDDVGLSVADKIKKLLTFRIPYYVGPLNPTLADPKTGNRIFNYAESLNDKHKQEGDDGFSWIAKKKPDVPVLPWNFEDVVNEEECANRFMRRLTSKCTYLTAEDVLPKNSPTYQEFMVLNAINNLSIHGSRDSFTPELKQKLFHALFREKSGKVSKKKIAEFLRCDFAGKIEAENIGGIDDKVEATLSTYHAMKKIFGNAMPSLEEQEEAIRLLAILGQAPKMLKTRMAVLFSHADEKQLKALCAIPAGGWGRLSMKFLKGIVGWDKESAGECFSLLELMWQRNKNMMELLHGSNFLNVINTENNKQPGHDRLTYDAVDSLYVSPAVKRPIWQTLTIIKELQQILADKKGEGEEKFTFKKVFIEVARDIDEKNEKKKPKSRKDKLVELYKKCKEEEREGLLSSLDNKADEDLRQDRLYLYYTQLGRCMYTGRHIDIESLNNFNVYDIDHIYPQSKVKDDSLSNRVLVCREHNARKEDKYPLPPEIRDNMADFWQLLRAKDLISKPKFERLKRQTDFTADEEANFVARQLVEVRQSTKAVAEILKRAMSKTEIVYSKAGNVSDFRQLVSGNDADLGGHLEFVKLRDLNNYHHAKDAYLNVVVGNVYHEKFTADPRVFFATMKDKEGYSMKPKSIFGADLEQGKDDNKRLIWTCGREGTIQTVAVQIAKNNIFVTRMVTETKAGFYDQMPVKKKDSLIPLKSNDPRLQDTTRYGGYNKDSGAYWILVEHTVKGKGKKAKEERVRSLEYVPVRYAKSVETDDTFLQQYCREELGLENPDIRLDKIRAKSVIKINGFPFCVTGRSGDGLIFHHCVELCLAPDEVKCLKAVLKFVERRKEAKRNKRELGYRVEYDGFTEADTLHLYRSFLKKFESGIYKKSNTLKGWAKTLNSGVNHFDALSIEERCDVLAEVLFFFQCNRVYSDISKIGGQSTTGNIKISRTVSNLDSAILIHQSPTGFYTQYVDLLTV
ncbi:MAG: type II CRISPR RNA-guided endonuclease Cas9 [Proteobacteria bacterium]|nr:type II CRISPR RNA-guided endonuclease Cas9 [Pseudomonadota bacterium]